LRISNNEIEYFHGIILQFLIHYDLKFFMEKSEINNNNPNYIQNKNYNQNLINPLKKFPLSLSEDDIEINKEYPLTCILNKK